MRPTVFVLFGATGDLAHRMVLPAFYGLSNKGLMPDQWKLVGNGRGHLSDDGFRKDVHQALEDAGVSVTEEEWKKFAQHLRFAGSGFTADDPGELMDVLRDVRHDFGASFNLVHFLAIPPTLFEGYTRAIEAHGLTRNAKIVYEKPFGTSPQEFETLDRMAHDVFGETQIFRIDHFLGKEATQDIHVARFSNRIIESTWNRENIAAVQIDVPETLDIADRAAFYDHTGALLDMIVTHLFQLAAEVAMEQPVGFGAADVLDARETVIDAFRPLHPDDVVFGQYEGYRETEGIADDSNTDTFVAARLWVDTDRWHGVPFLLRTGKQMKAKAERVTLIYKRAEAAPHHQPLTPSTLWFDLAGNGGIEASFVLKQPGPRNELAAGEMSMSLSDLPNAKPLAPYERLIHDVLMGDHSRFTRSDGLRYAWRAVAPLLENRAAPLPYAVGSWGPKAADELADPYGWLATALL